MIKNLEQSLLSGNYQPEAVEYDESNFDGFCPAPLLIVGPELDQELIEKQDKLISHLIRLAYNEVLKQGFKNRIALFVARSVYIRMRKREALNSISYINRQNLTPDSSQIPDAPEPEVIVACEKAKHGGATAIQSHLARRAFAMESIELANLTTFGQTRSQLVEPMWQDIDELVKMKDGTEADDGHYRLNILGFDRDPRRSQHLGAIRIDAKRNISELNDGALIKARTTAIINTRPSDGLDKEYVDQLIEAGKEAVASPDDLSIEVPVELKQLLSQLLLKDSDLVIAKNDTVYEAPTKNSR